MGVTRAARKRKASTADILAPQVRARPIKPKWRQHYKRLVELRDELRRKQSDLAADAMQEQPTFSTHMADAGTDTFDRDFALGMLSSEQDAIYQIEQALDRIQNGTYGICELTGKPIERERLDAIPWTRFTAAAERQLEKEGSYKRSGLGTRESVVRVNAQNPPEDTE